jgi:hypothetical protein
MSISVQEFDVQQFRAEITKMSDAELMSLGRSLRSCATRESWHYAKPHTR